MKETDTQTLDYLKSKYGKATLSPREFANESGRSETHIRRLCANGTIRAAQIGSRWVIPIAVCAALIEGVSAND